MSLILIADAPEKLFKKCALDIVSPLTITNGRNKYILTFHDNVTKFSKSILVPNQEAATVVKTFVTKIEHGISEKLLINQDTNFTTFKNTCKLLKIEKI